MSMVIDTHIHPALFAPICEDPARFHFRCDEMNYHLMSPVDLELLKKQLALADIRGVFLLGEDCSYDRGQSAISNEEIARLAELEPELFIGFASVDPRCPDAEETLRRAFTELKLAGLCLNTAKCRLYPYDERIFRLCEVCRDYKKPVVLHSGLCLERNAFSRYARPADFEELIAAFPQVNFCLTHVGWPWVQETAALLIKYPNAYANTALMNFDGPVQLYHKVFKEDMGEYWVEHNLADKLMFGSDSPRIRPVRAKRGLDALKLRPDVMEKLCRKNALRFLGREDQP